MPYVVRGGGGASLYRTGSADWLAATARTHHFLRMQASATELSWEAVDDSGRVFDRWTLTRGAD